MCRFKLSSDFVVNADEDGEVVENKQYTHFKNGKISHPTKTLTEIQKTEERNEVTEQKESEQTVNE